MSDGSSGQSVDVVKNDRWRLDELIGSVGKTRPIKGVTDGLSQWISKIKSFSSMCCVCVFLLSCLPERIGYVRRSDDTPTTTSSSTGFSRPVVIQIIPRQFDRPIAISPTDCTAHCISCSSNRTGLNRPQRNKHQHHYFLSPHRYSTILLLLDIPPTCLSFLTCARRCNARSTLSSFSRVPAHTKHTDTHSIDLLFFPVESSRLFI